MDYYKNADKVCNSSDYGLYNTVTNVVFSAEGAEPVTLQEAKDWAKIEVDTDDGLIIALIKAARRMCESYSGIGFINRTVTAVINNANGNLVLPYGPVTVDPTAVDEYENELEIEYRLGAVVSLGRMKVTYTAGHSELPEDLKTALKSQFLFLHANRGESGVGGITPLALMILQPLRMVL